MTSGGSGPGRSAHSAPGGGFSPADLGFQHWVDLVDDPVDPERRAEEVGALVGVGKLDGLTGRGFRPLSSQLKVKPNGAWPVNTGPGLTWRQKYPPPLPVHAVSTTARMQAAASKTDRRKKARSPDFHRSPPKGVGDGGRVGRLPPS